MFLLKMKRSRELLFLFIFCAAFSGCDELNLFSSWRGSETVIDGKYTDWGDSLSHYDEKTKVVLNLANDADYFYICLVTRNREIETQIVNLGLVAWFDPGGGKNKAFGIRFPLGSKETGASLREEKRDRMMDWQDQEDKSGLIDREKEKLRDVNFNKHLELLEKLQDRLEIMDGERKSGNKNGRPGPPPKSMPGSGDIKGGMPDLKPGGPSRHGPSGIFLEEAGKLGIEAKVGRENDYFVYELKVPLVKSQSHPYAIEANSGQVGLGLEAGAHNAMPMGDGGMSGREPPDMDTNRMPSGMGPSARLKKNFQLWATVTLSSK